MMRSRNAIMAIIGMSASAILLTTAMPATAMASSAKPATVRPLTGEGCNGLECTEVVGTGLQITSISGAANNTSPLPLNNIHIEFYGPNGLITNTPQFNLPPYSSSGWRTWHNPNPSANMTPGDYCTELWQYVNGGYTGQSDCINVRA